MNPTYAITIVLPITSLDAQLSQLVTEASPHVHAVLAGLCASWVGEPRWRIADGADIEGWDAFRSVLVADVPIRVHPALLRVRKEERVRRLVAQGYSDTEIAAVLGIKPQSVWRYRKRHGIPNGRSA